MSNKAISPKAEQANQSEEVALRDDCLGLLAKLQWSMSSDDFDLVQKLMSRADRLGV